MRRSDLVDIVKQQEKDRGFYSRYIRGPQKIMQDLKDFIVRVLHITNVDSFEDKELTLIELNMLGVILLINPKANLGSSSLTAITNIAEKFGPEIIDAALMLQILQGTFQTVMNENNKPPLSVTPRFRSPIHTAYSGGAYGTFDNTYEVTTPAVIPAQAH